jgi:hypothetical protein
LKDNIIGDAGAKALAQVCVSWLDSTSSVLPEYSLITRALLLLASTN